MPTGETVSTDEKTQLLGIHVYLHVKKMGACDTGICIGQKYFHNGWNQKYELKIYTFFLKQQQKVDI